MRPRTTCLLLSLLLASCDAAAPAPISRPPSPHPDHAAIRAFLDRYFTTWSAQDIDAYAACFDADAKILFIDTSGRVVAMDLGPFIQSQRDAHARAPEPMTERPLEVSLQGDEQVVQATVTWVLHIDADQQHGTDYFTLRKTGGGWKIVTLVFRNAS